MSRPKSRRTVTCANCGNSVDKRTSELNRSNENYCSRKCGFAGKRGKVKKIRPIEESKWRINKKGYLETTRRRKRVYQHRWVMENHLGRPLKDDEFIHHLNGIKTENCIDNLIIISSTLHSKSHKSVIAENKAMRQLLINISNDPGGLNRNWIRNMNLILQKEAI